MSIDLLLLLFTTLLLLVWYVLYGRPSTEPPGPWGLPLVGYLPFLGKKMNLTINNLAKRYGNVFQLRMGSRKVVVISGQRCVREALLRRGLEFAGRPNFYSYTAVSKFGFSDMNPSFRMYKKQTMKAFGEFTKTRRNELQQVAHNSVNMLMKKFKEANNMPFDPKRVLDRVVCTIMGYICYGEFFNIEDELVTALLDKAQDFATFIAFGLVCDFLPWSKFLIRHKLRRLEELLCVFNKYADKIAMAHIGNYDGENMRSMCDIFRKVAEGMNEEERKVLKVDDDMLKNHLSSIFGAGFSTTAGTLKYAILIMAIYPEVQTKVQLEIDSVIGGDRYPAFDDESRLVYTSAVVTEIYRYHSLAALGVTHSTTCNTIFEGYFIRKDTPVIFNMYSAHRDDTVFTDPERFMPERFIRLDGTFNCTLAQYVSPYSIGFRRCAGEPVARLEVSVFFATILQQCRIESAPDHPLDLDNYIMTFGIYHKPFKVIFRSRFGEW
ncbi:Cytochrome P450 1A1 [Oopsacas minuta]|uniref:unspecific monooxygenase n=1 Tax=Oopsacas minuta TaxID=111878 RepID=A0AAV7KDV3_9METZ|nr:Cytochrome P450 1A1 [Oopsacas minuta]